MLVVLAAGALVNCGVGPVGQVLIMADRPWTVALDNLAVTALVVIGLLLAAPAAGVVAAAGVMAVALAGVNLVRAWRVWREHGVLPWNRRTGWLWLGFLLGVAGIFMSRGALPGMTGRVIGMAVYALVLGGASLWLWKR